ncbi:MAG: Pycsar system effector family protein [bacterium]
MGKHDQEDDPNKRKSALKAKNADRAMDNMFRIVLANHFQLSAMADTKANMLITVCALILSLSLGRITDPSLFPTIVCMGLTCVCTILLAVYATMPNLPPRLTPPINPRAPGFNLIFFGHFSQLDFDTFFREMEQVVNDRALVYESLAKDLYRLGKVLSERKYRFVRYSYMVFMAGLVISILVMIITLSVPAEPSPPSTTP